MTTQVGRYLNLKVQELVAAQRCSEHRRFSFRFSRCSIYDLSAKTPSIVLFLTVSSVLKSPDGNWIALQSAQLSRPTRLTQRKSLVYSALERESRVTSAYEGLESDGEGKPEPDSSWGAVLKEIHRKVVDSNLHLHDDNSVAPPMDHQVSRDDLFSDPQGNWKLALLKRKVPAEIRKPSSSRRTSIIDVNFNLKGDGEGKEESKMAAEPETSKIRRSRKKRSKKEATASSSVSV